MSSIGVLALQGCVEPHCTALTRLGCAVQRVRLADDLKDIERLILPGGESTTMLTLLERRQLLEPLRLFAESHPIWGVCAGAILLAQEVVHPTQKSLGLIGIRAHRNYYGSQRESFSAPIESSLFEPPLQADFIRAPCLEPLNPSVEILGTHRTQAVLLKQGRILVSSFHTELSTDTRLHSYFLSL